MAASRATSGNDVNHNNDSNSQSADHIQNATKQYAVMQRTTAVLDLSMSKRFILPKQKNYAPQYAHIYFCRLKQLREHVEKSARAAFGKESETLRYVKSIVDAGADDPSRDTVLTGVVFREMQGKPSILAQYEKPSPDHLIPNPPPRANAPLASESDRVFLEDDNARCALDVSMLSHEVAAMLVTGLVIAVRGREDRTTGAFSVSAVTTVDPAPQPRIGKPINARRLVCLISAPGLTPVAPAHELLLETLCGSLDIFNMDSADDISPNQFGPSIVHTILAGNLISPALSVPPPHMSLSSDEKNKLTAALRDADAFLSALTMALPVSVMPGPDDATNALLPQQPLHRCLLPGAMRSANLSRVPNPFACTIDGTLFLGTSGQNVDDLALYNPSSVGKEITTDSKETTDCTFHANGEQVLDIMELMINNRHLAPTCPDTLGVYPFTELDPFVLEQCPHVMFVGNQKEFSTRVMKLPIRCSEEADDSMIIDSAATEKFVRLVSIPRFDKTGQAVFVDLNTLECEVREFGLTITD